MILLTGATGNVGSILLERLAEQQVHVRALVRTPPKSGPLSRLDGVEWMAGDLADEATIARACRGADRLFLLTPSSENAEAQQLAIVRAAAQAGVRHLVKLSQLEANPRSPVRFLRYHAEVERAVRDSGLAYTFLRPNLFMQGLLGFRQAIATQGKFFASIGGDARVSAIDVRDIAAAAAAALTDSRHEGKTYDLTGPEALTHAEMAAQLSVALRKPVAFVQVPPDAMKDALASAGFPRWQADGLLEDYAHYDRGEAATVTSGVVTATGRPPRTFAQFARDFASAFVA